jgi:sarcosine oxidase
MNDYEVIVIGLGAMGSAAVYHLAENGKRVLGLDRFTPPHDQGSSHGRTRIIREAYFEHPIYVPLVQRAYELWAGLEKTSGRQLLLRTGGVMVGPPGNMLVTGAKASAERHKLEHQILSRAEMRRRFPVFDPGPDMVGLWEPRAGILFPELIIQTHLDLAASKGATLKFNNPVLRWEPHGNGVQVFTASGVFTARRLLLSAGAWLNSLIPDLDLPLAVERQVLYWFKPISSREQFGPRNCPIHIWEYENRRFFYGFPDIGDGVKVALHHQGEMTGPGTVRREVAQEEIESMRGLLRRFLPCAEGPLISTAVCIYTNTPDEHFILDLHPAFPQVVIASPCSGHGFKFSSVIGELAARMLDGAAPAFDLSLFKLARFGAASGLQKCAN